jgi:hypothetical protein
MTHQRFRATLFLLLTGALPALAQPRPGNPELTISRIVLFSSGVGYFQREGQVDGDTRVDLQFRTENINDLLKSLVVQDKNGGRISTVSYDSRDPIDKTLKSFIIDLTQNPSRGQLLRQVRGERVEVVYGEPGKEGRPATLTGIVVGVERHRKPASKDQVIETEQLNLLTAEGMQGVTLDQVQRIRFTRPELEQEFRKALEVLAAGHDKQKKTVSLTFLGHGKRGVRVGYLLESPIWKASYRLSLDEGNNAFLQGWAIVENTTDEDWKQVRLGLVSGRPISFEMDLYEPLYVPRPLVEPELFASLRPPSYSGDLQSQGASGGFGALGGHGALGGMGGLGIAGGGLGALGMGGGGMGSRNPAQLLRVPRGLTPAGQPDDENEGERIILPADKNDDLNFRQGVASAAVATELGDYFKYEIEQPVSLPRQKSALLPIVDARVEACRLSIYNEKVHPKFPLLGLRFKNTTALHLMQGPITIFHASAYAGDSRFSDVQPNEVRLLSYAVDLGTEVAPGSSTSAINIAAVKICKGIMRVMQSVQHQTSYTIKNRSEHDRTVLIEHPYRADRTLVKPAKDAERSRDFYRFEVVAKPNQPYKLEVLEEEKRFQQIALRKADDQTIRLYLSSTASSPKTKEVLQRILKLKGDLEATEDEIAREEHELRDIESDQSRMRENMKALPQTSDTYRRYVKKFDAQETDIEQRRVRTAKLHETADQARKAFELFVANVNVE